MRRSLYWKVLAGCFLALSGLITILNSVIFIMIPKVAEQAIPTLLGLGGAGGALVIIGLVKARTATPSDPNGETGDQFHFFSRPQFWGTILLVSSLSTFIFRRSQPPAEVVARPAVVVAKPVVATPEKIPAVDPGPPEPFPELNLQGAVSNGAKSTALINGQVLVVGESVAGARVIEIDQTVVTVEFFGEIRKLRLE